MQQSHYNERTTYQHNLSMKTITYKERQRYLPPTRPKMFTSTSLLKSTILQNYKTIFTSHTQDLLL